MTYSSDCTRFDSTCVLYHSVLWW